MDPGRSIPGADEAGSRAKGDRALMNLYPYFARHVEEGRGEPTEFVLTDFATVCFLDGELLNFVGIGAPFFLRRGRRLPLGRLHRLSGCRLSPRSVSTCFAAITKRAKMMSDSTCGLKARPRERFGGFCGAHR